MKSRRKKFTTMYGKKEKHSTGAIKGLEKFVQEEKSEKYKTATKKKVLTTRGRKELSEKDFALPGRKYPIHDAKHARNALARVAQNGSATEKAIVRRKVKARYPGISVA